MGRTIITGEKKYLKSPLGGAITLKKKMLRNTGIMGDESRDVIFVPHMKLGIHSTMKLIIMY